jgi:hypothetical protein
MTSAQQGAPADAGSATESPEGHCPDKPREESGFDPPVAWLFGRQLISGLKWIALYAAFGEKLDAKDWMRPKLIAMDNVEAEGDELWFDYIADTGDGQKATYSIAYLCLSDLWVEGTPKLGCDAPLEPTAGTRLPRGAFLFVGGDTAYHIADYATLARRFQDPFRWAHCELEQAGRVSVARRPIFGIPGNHDYYDSLDGFNRQFRRPSTPEGDPGRSGLPPQLSIPGFERRQEASYVALRLPFGWWLFGLDAQGGKLDFRQREFFSNLNGGSVPKKLIVATPEPPTVFGRRMKGNARLIETFDRLGLDCAFWRAGALPAAGTCRLYLAGDTHHYARYWGPASRDGAPSAANFASVVSGLGGGFLHPTDTDVGEVEEQALYPSPEHSRREVTARLLDPLVIMRGGYIWLAGLVAACIIYLAATVPESSRAVVQALLGSKNEALLPLAWVLIALVAFGLSAAGLLREGARLDQRRPSRRSGKRDLTRIPAPPDAATEDEWRFWAWAFGMLLIPWALIWPLGVPGGAETAISAFARSVAVLVSLSVSLAAIAVSAWHTDRVAQQARTRTVTERDYLPAGVLVGVALLSGGLGIYRFGHAPAAALASDLLFLSVLLLVVLGLIGLAAFVGGELHGGAGKLGFAALGAWHALLQLWLPFAIARTGFSWALAAALALVPLFMWVGNGVAARLRTPWALLALWLLYGGLQLWLPAYLDRPPGVTDEFSLFKLLLAGALGAVYSCVCGTCQQL